MTIVDSQFYIIDSLSLDVSFGMKCFLGGCLVVSMFVQVSIRPSVTTGVTFFSFLDELTV